ncbi:MAG: hypothetical protein ACUVWB_01080 [Anaerolineae bacterium]
MGRKISLPLIILVMTASIWILGACGSSPEVNAPTPALAPAPTMTSTPEAPSTPALEPAPTPLPAADGQALVQERCTVCHSLDRVRQSRKTEAEWKATVERMRGKGARLSADELEVVIRYLASTYPK